MVFQNTLYLKHVKASFAFLRHSILRTKLAGTERQVR